MDALQTLINTLTKPEKRYFKMFATAFKAESELVKLFNTLDTGKDISDKDLQHKTTIKNMAAARSNLRKLVLKAMRNYREGNSVKQQMRDTLSDIDFLITKRLLPDARKEISKARKVAEADENYIYLLQLAVMESYTVGASAKRELFFKDIQFLQSEVEKSIGGVKQYAEAVVLQKMMALYAKTLDFTDNELRVNTGNNFAEQAQAFLETNTSAYAALINRSTIALTYSHISGRANEAFAINNTIYDSFENMPRLMHTAADLYGSFMVNYANTLARLGDKYFTKTIVVIEKCESSFDLLKDFYASRPDLKFEYQQRLALIKLSFIMELSGKVPFEIDTIESAFKYHIVNNDFLQIETLAPLQLGLLTTYFVLQKNSEKTLEWINTYYTLDDAKLLKPLAFVVRLNEVFAFYFSGELEICDTKAQNLYKTMHEQGLLKDRYHNTLGKLLRKLSKWNMNNEKDHAELSDITADFDQYRAEHDEIVEMYATYINAPKLCRLVGVHKH